MTRAGFLATALLPLLSGCSPQFLAATGIGAAVGATILGSADPAIPEDGPYFYRDRPYGSDATAGPLDMLLNKGYATAQWEGKGRNIFDYPYGWRGALRSVTHPAEALREGGGFSAWFREQFVPFSDDEWKRWNWAPNYGGHVLEGGIAYRRLREWYQARGVPYAGLTAGVTTWLSAFVNEAYEQPNWTTASSAAFADLVVFDVAGMLLFESDAVAGAFARKLSANVWPTQAAFTTPDGLLMNNSHHLVMKVPLLVTDRARVFLKAGIGFQGGLSVRVAPATDVSFAVGKESRVRFIDRWTKEEHAEFGWAAGVWLDRGNAVLASLLLDEHTDRFLAVNVYPGVLSVAGGRFGAWFVLDDDHDPFLGLSFRRGMGLGLGMGF